MTEDFALDRDTKYQTYESFWNAKVPSYISKSLGSKDKVPFGAFLLIVDKKYFGSDDEANAKTAQTLRTVIDSVRTASPASQDHAVSFDVKAREENQFWMLARVASQFECDMLRAKLYDEMTIRGYNNIRIAAKSFSPFQEQVTPDTVRMALENRL
jgi:hypothetical protein